MRIPIGKVVDTSKDVDLSSLSPLDKIIAAATSAYHETSIYQRRFAENEERANERLRKRRELLLSALLSVTYQHLEKGVGIPSTEHSCDKILVEVSPKYTPLLNDVLSLNDLDSYDIQVINPSRSLSKFCKAPVLLLIEKRGDLDA